MEDIKLPLEVGDKVIIKSTGGNYSTYIDFFDETKKLLVAQMGNAKYLMAKTIYCNEVKNTKLLRGETYEGVRVEINKEYEVIGFAPWGGFDSDTEVLVLVDDCGHVRLFANFKNYFKEPPKHVYVDDLKEVFGEDIILHLDEGDFEIH